MATDPARRANGTMKKGHSANPNGRPPRSRNMLKLFNEKRDELVKVMVDDKPVLMSRMEAFITNLWNKAVELDPKAVLQVIAILRASGQLAPDANEVGEIDEASAAALNALVSRMFSQKGSGSAGEARDG